jgi:nucleosome assembly protein 1-like 1
MVVSVCLALFVCFPQIPTNPEDLEDEELDALQEELSADFDIGYAIKDQIIPRAVEW